MTGDAAPDAQHHRRHQREDPSARPGPVVSSSGVVEERSAGGRTLRGFTRSVVDSPAGVARRDTGARPMEQFPVKPQVGKAAKPLILLGAPGPTRTGTSLRTPDFESGASTGSATGAGTEAAHNTGGQTPVNARWRGAGGQDLG